ncbi:MAG TPA: hemerythrin domain-containing protein [Burkholderiales bacterium]|nr:hemerythrin domain-containing protein [Burkholderiales bacterium]
MGDPVETVDLREESDNRLALSALAAARELRPGHILRLLTRDDPALLLRSLNLQLRDALAWTSAQRPDGWQATVRLALDTPARDAIDLLTRDHRRLDELLGRVLRRLNAGDAAGAKPMLDDFAAGLRRHVEAENLIVAPELGPEPVVEPLEVMLHEHEQLLLQLDEVEKCFAEAAPGAVPQSWEVEPFVAILSGTLAKHEHREEGNLFPIWAARLAQRPAAVREALQRRVSAALAG